MGDPHTPDDQRWTFVSFRTTVEGKAIIDRLRGPVSRSKYIRGLIEQEARLEAERRAARARTPGYFSGNVR